MTDTSKASAPKRALGATLAGVLAVGMVPAVAFAEQAPEPEALDNGIESLATKTETAQLGALAAPASTTYTAGTKAPAITTVNLQGGGTAATNTLVSAYGFTSDSLVWFEVSDSSGEDSGYVTPSGQPIYYASGATFNTYDLTAAAGTGYPDAPGTYAVVAANTTSGSGNVSAIEWQGNGQTDDNFAPDSDDGVRGGVIITVTPASFAGAYVCDKTNANNTTFPFKGSAYTFSNDLDIAIDGVAINAADYTATITGGSAFFGGQAKYAGTYTVQIIGKNGTPYEGQETTLSFTISPVNLNGYNLALEPSTQASAENDDVIANLLVNGQPTSNFTTFNNFVTSNLLQITPVPGAHPYPTNGVYYPTLTANTSGMGTTEAGLLQNSFIGLPASVTYSVVDNATPATTFTYAYYNGTSVNFGAGATPGGSSYSSPLVFNKDAGQVFDPRQVSAQDPHSHKVPGDAIELQYYAVTANTSTYLGTTAPTAPGIYCVVASVNPTNADVNYDYDGTSYLYIQVTNGTVSSATLTFTYNNNGTTTNIDQVTHGTSGNAQLIGTYTGQPQAVNVQAKLTDSGTVLPASAYTVTIVQIATGSGAAITPGKVVSEMVDAGVYQITVTSTDYTFTTSNRIYVKINRAPLSNANVRITGTVEGNLDGVRGNGSEVGWFYTGQNITPQLQWNNGTEWLPLPTSQYDLSLKYSDTDKTVATGTNPTAIKAAGYYQITYNDEAPAAPAADNFTASSFLINDPAANPAGVYYVTDDNVYADVPTDVWFAKPVFEASDLGYMTGYQGSALFGPTEPLLRGQAAIILSRMAGAEQWLPGGATGSTISFPTKFTDVDPDAYYAKAILWADELGVMSGNGPAYTTFSPNDAISREQFAAILFNYAKKTGNYTAPTSAQMATVTAMPDWNAVSPWAREAVAWAVANKVMGNNGEINPQATVIRAEAAAMCVNYQPGGILTTPLIPSPVVPD